MIGLAAGILLMLNGDIMGISGIVNPLLLDPQKTWRDSSWKWIFIAAMFATVSSIQKLNPSMLIDPDESEVIHSSSFTLLLGGFLVGVGTKQGNGCTSGHGKLSAEK